MRESDSGSPTPEGTDPFAPTTQLADFADAESRWNNVIVVDDADERNALASPELRSDIIAVQRDDDSVWLCTDASGPTWKLLYQGLPDPVSVIDANQRTVTATAFADIPVASITTPLVLARDCWVEIDVRAWVAATAADVRVSSAVTGATTVAENSSGNGAIGYSNSASTFSVSSKRVVKLNAGSNTITARAMRGSASGTQSVAYTVLTVTPIRYDD